MINDDLIYRHRLLLFAEAGRVGAFANGSSLLGGRKCKHRRAIDGHRQGAKERARLFPRMDYRCPQLVPDHPSIEVCLFTVRAILTDVNEFCPARGMLRPGCIGAGRNATSGTGGHLQGVGGPQPSRDREPVSR